jgi:hypothetical protein
MAGRSHQTNGGAPRIGIDLDSTALNRVDEGDPHALPTIR